MMKFHNNATVSVQRWPFSILSLVRLYMHTAGSRYMGAGSHLPKWLLQRLLKITM